VERGRSEPLGVITSQRCDHEQVSARAAFFEGVKPCPEGVNITHAGNLPATTQKFRSKWPGLGKGFRKIACPIAHPHVLTIIT
jgi:hypothetical protein